MSKLYEARRSNLSNPLTKDEVGYTFNCENINYIINNIDEEKYGSYLIGGIVGTGKSSLVDIAAAYSKKKTLTIHVNFYNEKEIIENFSFNGSFANVELSKEEITSSVLLVKAMSTL